MKRAIITVLSVVVVLNLAAVSQGAVWDGSSDTDWSGTGDATSWSGSTYIDGVDAQFNGAGAGTVNITANVAPGSVSVNDGGANYTFAAGGGVITGGGTLTKDGAGTLTINTANTYSGGTTLTNGTLIVGNGSAVGTGTLTLGGGTLRTGSTGATLIVPTVVSGTTAVFAGAANLGLNGAVSGAGALNVGGSGSGQGANSRVNLALNILNGFTGTLNLDNTENYIDLRGANTSAKLMTSGATSGQHIRLWEHSTFGELSGTGGLIVGDNRTLTINQSTDTTYGGLLLDVNTSRELGFTKGGTGRLTLTNTGNSYEFATTVNGGTLEVQGRINETASISVASGATFEVTGSGSLGSGGVYAGGGSGSGYISNSGTFEYNSTTDQTLSGIIFGTGVLIKDNTSTLTLTGANTYSGATTVSNGTLKLQGDAFFTKNRDYSIASGAVLNLDGGASIAAGTSDISGGGALLVTGGSLGAGANGRDLTLSLGSNALIDIDSGGAIVNGGWQAINWNSNLADLNVDGTLNVGDGATVKVDALTGSGTINKTWGAGTVALQVGVDNGSGTFSGTIGGEVDGAIAFTKSGTGTQTLSGANTYAGATTVSLGTLKLGAASVIPDGSGKGDVTVNGTLDLNGYSETINGLSGAGTIDTIAGGTPTLTVGNDNATSTFSGTITNTLGSLALTKDGTGALTLSGASTYSGGTTLNSGKLTVANSEAIGTGALTLNGGTLSNADGTSVNLDEAIVVTGTTAVFTEATAVPNGLTLSGDITGSGTINLGGSGSGQGARFVNISDNLDGFTGTMAFEAVSGGNKILFGAANTTAALALSGITGGDYVGFQSANATFGELSGAGGKIIAWNRRLTINQDTDTTFGGVLLDVNTNNKLGFTKGGSGRLTLTGQNSYEFSTIVNGTGTLEVQGRIGETAGITVGSSASFEVTGSGSLGAGGVYNGGGSGSGNISNDGTFEYNSTTDQELSGVISGAGVLVKDNSSTLTLTGANTYSGGTTLNSGALDIAHADSALGTGALTLAGGTLNNTSALANNQLDVDIVASGTNAVFAGSGGNLTLNGGVSGAGTLNFGGSGSGQGNKAVNVYLSDLSGFTGTIRHDAVSNGNYLYFGQGGATVNTTAKLETTGLTGGNRYVRFFENATFGELSGTGGRILSRRRLTIDQSTDTTYAGRLENVNGVLSLTKDGSGALNLSGVNVYTGPTIVDGGTLLVDGTTGASSFTVNSGATVGGTGSIGGAVTVNNGGHIAPGASIGTITMTAGLTLSDGSILDIEADAAGAADKILLTGGTFTGATSADGVTLNVTFSGTPKQGAYTLIDWSSAAGESGVDLADFDLVLTAPASGIHDLVIVDQTLLLTVVTSTVFKFQ
jgi:fibronectin-binding autotransporter adhesin